jgi:anti-sigma B factor antagonist
MYVGRVVMSLHIEQRESEGIVILDMKGPLTLGEGDLELRDRLAALHEAGKVNIILNLREVTEIDSTGLGTLVFGLARLGRAEGRLALLNLNRTHLKLFLLTKLALAFEFFDDEQDAINSFFPDRALKHFDILDFVEHEHERESNRGVSSQVTC